MLYSNTAFFINIHSTDNWIY